MKKIYYSWQDVQGQALEIIRQISKDGWIPDYVVGITRGGLTPANLISQYLEVPMETIKVSLRDDNSQPESNLWMSEDAYNGKNILIVDDINDSGATLDWIKQDWQESCLSESDRWFKIWNGNVRFATLVHNEASEFQQIDYFSVEVNKANEDCWIVFPWEDWWQK